MSYLLRRSTSSCSLLLQLTRLSSVPCFSSSLCCHDTTRNPNYYYPRPLAQDEPGFLFFLSRSWLHTTSSRMRSKTKLKESTPVRSDDVDPHKPADYDPSNFDATECRSPPSEKVIRIVDEIANLTLLEASDLSHLLKKKLGLPDSAMPYPGAGMAAGIPMAQAAGDGSAAAEEKKPEKSTFDVKLEKFDAASKIKIIKEVRAFTALGLKEAKELVEKAPAILKKGVTKEEAEQICEKIKAVGGTAIME